MDIVKQDYLAHAVIVYLIAELRSARDSLLRMIADAEDEGGDSPNAVSLSLLADRIERSIARARGEIQ